ncbi:MAG: hypothetical protein FWE14_08140 [Lachnospiraceae bacterium]|nr:hypothetical protein [Lachnospiraceae bacterium]
MPFERHKYTKCAVIVHGKSELNLVKYIYTNLHLPVKIIAKEKGNKSIQINGLLAFMQGGYFKSLKSFADEYSIEYDNKNKCLLNFKLFIIMDTDDCDEYTRDNYISGELFRGHILEKYIVPLYNIANLEEIMIKAEIMVRKISGSEKGSYYTKIFPINTKPISIDTIEQVKVFANKIKNIKQTNMLEFIDYCLSQLEVAKK